jgi:peroxiredoxin (alkyl hydroperoxide reductase subunit C)
MSVLVAKEAPDFTAPAVMPNGVIEEKFTLSSLRGKYVVLFFWPLDFTFVCPTEIIAHDHRMAQFQQRNLD